MMHTVQYVTIFPLGVGRRWANIAQAGWVSTDLRHYRLLVLRRALPSIHSEAILAIHRPTATRSRDDAPPASVAPRLSLDWSDFAN